MRLHYNMSVKRKISFMLAVIMAVLLLLTAFSFVLSNPFLNQLSVIGPDKALHVSGKNLVDTSSNIVVLRGFNYGRLIDSATGDWILSNGQTVYKVWDQSAIASNLDAMQQWNGNVIRLLFTIEWWKENTNNFHSNVKSFLDLAAARGIYVVFVPWRVSGTGSSPDMPYPPYQESSSDTAIIPSVDDFVTFWGGVASELKGYPNVLFEFWNEPHGEQTLWFNTVQQCITAVRNTGANNVIVVQWGYGAGIDMAGYSYYEAGSRIGSIYHVDWIEQNSLSDPLSNILWSTHLYRSNFYDSSQGYKKMGDTGYVNYTSNDLEWALDIIGVTSNNKALWIGEIGPNHWATVANEYLWYNYVLKELNQNGVGFAAWEWWNGGAWTHLGYANYGPNQAGEILKANLAGESYTSPSPSNTPISTPNVTPTPSSSGTAQTPNPTVTPTENPSYSPTPTPSNSIDNPEGVFSFIMDWWNTFWSSVLNWLKT